MTSHSDIGLHILQEYRLNERKYIKKQVNINIYFAGNVEKMVICK